jgi:hypothetical protein
MHQLLAYDANDDANKHHNESQKRQPIHSLLFIIDAECRPPLKFSERAV